MRISKFDYVILGGGVVAGYAAREFVEQEIEPGQLAIVSADDTLPYERPPLSKGYLTGEKDTQDILINAPSFYDEHEITVFLDTRITNVDLHNRQLLAGDDDVFQFDKLLVATGSRPRKLDVPGSELDGIHYLRSENQSRRIAADIADAEQVVVVGGGYIGMEVASVLAGQGIAVTMIFPEERLMQAWFTPEMSKFFQDYYEARGVTFRPGTKPVAFTGDDCVTGVTLDSGDELPADFVVAGIGVVPATELFEGTGMPIDDGIIVNKYLETNWDGVFAAGDVANYYDVIFQKRRRAEHWDNAVKQGQHAARIMTASRRKQREQFMYLRYFFSDVFDLSYEFWGDTSQADRVVYRGDMSEASFSVWWLAGNRLDAVFVLNRPDDERAIAPEWIKMRRRVRPENLQDATQPLNDLVVGSL